MKKEDATDLDALLGSFKDNKMPELEVDRKRLLTDILVADGFVTLTEKGYTTTSAGRAFRSLGGYTMREANKIKERIHARTWAVALAVISSVISSIITTIITTVLLSK